MPSWLSASASAIGEAGDGILRRFLEASRRAEIVTLVNAARTEAEVAQVVVEELGEALEAEVAFILAADAGRTARMVLAQTGLSAEQAAAVGRDGRCAAALDSDRAQMHDGRDLFGLGARRLVLSPWVADDGRRILIGVARLYEEGFDASEVALLEAVTESVGFALERAWLGSERDRHAARQTSLIRAAKALNASLVIPEVLEALCREIVEALAADVVAVYFTDERGELRAVAGLGVPDGALGGRQPEAAPPRTVMRTGTSMVLQPEPDDDIGLPGVTGVRCGFVVPARRRAEFDGALLVGFRDDRSIGDADVELLAGFAELAGIAHRNADEHTAVQRAAMLDSLTGCLNHGAFHDRLGEEISRADRTGRSLTLISIDFDDFKSVNDRFGHPTGDALLRTLADALRDAVRTYDQVGRLGGDEFMLLLQASEGGTARRVLDRALAAMARVRLPDGATVTVSAGVADWRLGEDADLLVGRADGALLEAKAARGASVRGEPAGSELTRRRRGSGRRPKLERAAEGAERQHLTRLAEAGALGTRLARMLDQPAILETAIADLQTQLGYERCLIVRRRPSGGLEVLAAARPEPTDPRESPTDPPRAPLEAPVASRRAVVEGQAVLINRAEPLPGEEGGPLGGKVRSQLAAPLCVGTEPWGAIELQSSVAGAFAPADALLLGRVAEHVGSALQTAELHKDLKDTYLRTAAALATALEAKDRYTAAHARSIAELAVHLGRAMHLDEEDIGDLRYGALLHDIGKIAIPDAILNKRGPLDPAEMRIVREHPLVGERILAPISFRPGIRRIVRHDHERWDGLGYPDGLRGEEIPLGARIVFVVDAFDAMTSDRPYREAMPHPWARRELERHAGTQFDPTVVRALLETLDAAD